MLFKNRLINVKATGYNGVRTVLNKRASLTIFYQCKYSHLFNKRGGWNKCGGDAIVAKSLNMQIGINVEGGIYWKNLVHISNKRVVEGGKI